MFVNATRELVRKCHADGLSAREIAASLEVADNTVRYHLARLAASPSEGVERVATRAFFSGRNGHQKGVVAD